MERRTGAGARILDIDYGNPLEAHAAKRDLAAHHDLPFQQTLRRIGIECRADVGLRYAGIRQSLGDGALREILDRPAEKLSERRHADPDDKSAGHRSPRLSGAVGPR